MADKQITIGVLTSGGDTPGMNAAVRAVVRIGINKGFRVIGIYRGYHGLFKEEFRELTAFDVRDTVQHGGTVLYTARSKSMMQPDGPARAAEILKNHGIRTRIRGKISEGSEDILRSIRAGYVSYIINTRAILSGIHYQDGIAIRRCAIMNGITMFTSLDTVRILLDVLEDIVPRISDI